MKVASDLYGMIWKDSRTNPRWVSGARGGCGILFHIAYHRPASLDKWCAVRHGHGHSFELRRPWVLNVWLDAVAALNNRHLVGGSWHEPLVMRLGARSCIRHRRAT